jgi:hypothetical protein
MTLAIDGICLNVVDYRRPAVAGTCRYEWNRDGHKTARHGTRLRNSSEPFQWQTERTRYDRKISHQLYHADDDDDAANDDVGDDAVDDDTIDPLLAAFLPIVSCPLMSPRSSKQTSHDHGS